MGGGSGGGGVSVRLAQSWTEFESFAVLRVGAAQKKNRTRPPFIFEDIWYNYTFTPTPMPSNTTS